MSWQDDWIERGIPEEEWPNVLENEDWEIKVLERLTAYKNRPGEKKMYVNTKGIDGQRVGAVRIGFDVEGGEAIAFDHKNIYGYTGTRHGNLGFLVWEHFGKPTRYIVTIEGKIIVTNLRTDLGNEYPMLGEQIISYRPVNRPGIYSYRFEIQKKSE